MANAYYKENIERITEQTLEEEIKDELRDIKETAIKTIDDLGKEGIANCDKTKNDAISQMGKDGQETLTYISNKKKEMSDELNEDLLKLYAIDSEASDIYYDNMVNITSDTEAKIETDIRQMIVNNGYHLEIVNDGNGNVNLNLGQVV